MNKAHIDINWENYPSDETPLNERNLNKMDGSIDIIDDRVITLDTTKATKAEVATLVADVTFEESTGIITITKKNGSKITIDTQMEKIAINFDYNPITQQIILTLIDGTKQYIDLSALITQYEFHDSDTVAFYIDKDGKVSAIVKEGSIEEKHLEPNYLAKIKVEVAKAESSQQAAAKSEINAKASENAAKASETAAKTSETNAKASETAAAKSATAAAISETNAKASETSASQSAATATSEAASASQSASTAIDKATIATQKATEIIGKAESAAESAAKAQSYAVGGTGSREGEDSDNAKYYYQQAKDVSEGLKGGLQPHGTVAFADLPALADVSTGWMFNISDEFTTTDDFKEGAGNVIPAGANIYKTSDEKWDVLAGTPVTGIKGVNEDSFRRGNVELTAENVGAVATGGDTAENTATFTSSDVADGSASAWTTVSKLSSGEKHSSIFAKVSQMFKNVRYLYKMLGTTDISKIGNGTCTGAISSLNSSLANHLPLSGGTMTGTIIGQHKLPGSTASDSNGMVLGVQTTGNTGIFNGNGDGNGAGVANLIIKSWYGVGFVDGCSGQGMTVGIDCRSGNITCNSITIRNVGSVTDLLNSKLSTSASCNKNWNWSGKNETPAWIWGGSDGTNMYVYNPTYILVQGIRNRVTNRAMTITNDNHVRTYESNGVGMNGAISLGSANYRFSQLYVTSSSISTSDKNYKDDIKSLTDKHLQFFMKLQPVSFLFKDGTSGRTHIGFIAQDVEQAMSECGLTDLDFAGFCKDQKIDSKLVDGEEVNEPILDENGNPEYIYSLRYEEFIALNTYVIQELWKRVDAVEKENIETKNQIKSMQQDIAELKKIRA
ncbi:tail fiber domain-containing protein [Roseburia intestinalis]|uniref:Peptidase S74 domain-containing protein n=1 Tax=Roseburia intestinalis L1-82 TaxID=536231 RepID=A0AAQ2UBQ9_9FIRM|nr:tail fiber domain-containing protein [Roseburia intestinalis]UWP53906.1 tail fiber domain-containing protein [Roseburia intestinalis]VCV22352.1 hypothetical protein RIL182_02231 [Roseburia intestinalis L1-82]VUE37341.1 hypothetical protein [Roseburia phage Jekyll]